MNPVPQAAVGAAANHQQLFVSLYDELRQGGAANHMGATTSSVTVSRGRDGTPQFSAVENRESHHGER